MSGNIDGIREIIKTILSIVRIRVFLIYIEMPYHIIANSFRDDQENLQQNQSSSLVRKFEHFVSIKNQAI